LHRNHKCSWLVLLESSVHVYKFKLRARLLNGQNSAQLLCEALIILWWWRCSHLIYKTFLTVRILHKTMKSNFVTQMWLGAFQPGVIKRSIGCCLRCKLCIFVVILEFSEKSCPVGPGLQPSFDASSLPGCCQPSPINLPVLELNKGMKYWASGLNARGSRTFIATEHIAAAVLGWKRSGKERRGQTQFSTKFAAKLSFMPRWSPVYLNFPGFWNLIPYVTEQGVPVLSLPDFTDNFIISEAQWS
jgi:hypothetical protein